MILNIKPCENYNAWFYFDYKENARSHKRAIPQALSVDISGEEKNRFNLDFSLRYDLITEFEATPPTIRTSETPQFSAAKSIALHKDFAIALSSPRAREEFSFLPIKERVFVSAPEKLI